MWFARLDNTGVQLTPCKQKHSCARACASHVLFVVSSRKARCLILIKEKEKRIPSKGHRFAAFVSRSLYVSPVIRLDNEETHLRAVKPVPRLIVGSFERRERDFVPFCEKERVPSRSTCARKRKARLKLIGSWLPDTSLSRSQNGLLYTNAISTNTIQLPRKFGYKRLCFGLCDFPLYNNISYVRGTQNRPANDASGREGGTCIRRKQIYTAQVYSENSSRFHRMDTKHTRSLSLSLSLFNT